MRFRLAAFVRGCMYLALAMSLVASTAAALDVEDVKNLLRNQVGEEVILNMVQTDGTIFITLEEADALRAMGASENLVAAMRPRATTVYEGAAQEVIPQTVTTTTTVQTEAAQTVSSPLVVTETLVEGSPISPVPVNIYGTHPARWDKEGWLSISNHDLQPYYININRGDKRIFISRAPNGGMAVESGQNVVVNLRKETYKMYGDSGNKLEVKVRENETTRLSLNPFGVVGNSGLTGVSVDRDRVRSETLFNNYMPAPTVIIQEPSVIVAPPPPPPPGYYYHRPPYYGPRHGGSSFYFRYR